MAKQSEQEFNPVKSETEFVQKYTRELLHQFGSYYATSEKSFYDCIDPFLENFNPVKIEIPTHRIETHIPKLSSEEPQPEQPKVKTTAAFDNSRLEFLRMQIGPVQSFYQTLGNILFSLSMRLDVAEAKIENLKAHADQLNLERALYKRYSEYCKENELQWSEPGFVDFIREYAKEEEDEATANAK